MFSNSLITVIVPTYNREGLLPRAIESIRRQTYQDWELIIVDDNSTDNTCNLIQSFSKDDARIHYIRNRGKRGSAAARNFGIKQAKGEFIAFLDSDDEWGEHHLEDAMYVLERENIHFTFSYWYEQTDTHRSSSFDNVKSQEALESLKTQIQITTKDRYMIFPENYFEFVSSVKIFHCCHINTLVIRTNFLRQYGLFNEKMKCCEDSDLIFRLLIGNAFALIPRHNLIYHLGSDNLYFFIDRGNLDMDKVLNDKKLIARFTFNGYWHLEWQRIKINNIKRASCINDKPACIKTLHTRMAKKAFTIAYLNHRFHKVTAFYYYLKSFTLAFNKERVCFFINLLFPFLFRKRKANPMDLNMN